MKRRLTAVLCALALVLGLWIVPAGADDGLFFLILNDTPIPPSTQTTPLLQNSWVYVPVNVFNNRVSGVNFGIYYSFTDSNTNLTFYTLTGKTLTFDLVNNSASTSTNTEVLSSRCLWQNGICYVPAISVCSYYGLTYYYATTEYGPVFRIRDGNASLSDTLIVSAANSLFRSWYNAYQRSQTPPASSATAPSASAATPSTGASSASPSSPASTAPSTTAPSTSASSSSASSSATRPAATRPSSSSTSADSPAEEPEPAEETPEPVKTFSLYIGLRASGDVTAALDALSGVNATAIVFFPADDLAAQADQIRQAAGRGHQVGLIPQGDTPAQRLASAQEGSQTMARILRQETWFVLAGDQELTDAGYLCWSPTTTVPDTDSYRAVSEAGAAWSDASRVLANSSQTLAPMLNQLSQDGDTFLVPRETKY